MWAIETPVGPAAHRTPHSSHTNVNLCTSVVKGTSHKSCAHTSSRYIIQLCVLCVKKNEISSKTNTQHCPKLKLVHNHNHKTIHTHKQTNSSSSTLREYVTSKPLPPPPLPPMIFRTMALLLVLLLPLTTTDALLSPNHLHKRIGINFNPTTSSATIKTTTTTTTTQRHVSIGLGPEKQDDGRPIVESTTKPSLIPGIDYEIPDHDAFRTSRRSPIDETCDQWFASLLGKDGMMMMMEDEDDDTQESNSFFLRDVATAARTKLLTPVELKNEVCTVLLDFVVVPNVSYSNSTLHFPQFLVPPTSN